MVNQVSCVVARAGMKIYGNRYKRLYKWNIEIKFTLYNTKE